MESQMVSRRHLLSLFAVLGAAGVGSLPARRVAAASAEPASGFEITKSAAEWRRQLTPAQYKILREHGTERAGTSPLTHEKRKGTYACAGCDLPLFAFDAKYDSGTGWPSFYAPLPDAVGTTSDNSYFMRRTEVHCRRCGGHLGHVFDDGPKPTGLRYCINGLALTFHPAPAA
jgi:peptide-methionine (R)-S-oxide reductase